MHFKSFTTIATLTLLSQGALAANTIRHLPPKAPPALAILKKVEKNYSTAKTFSAEFDQKTFNKVMGVTKTQTGVIDFKLPGKIRWEEKSPDKTLLLSNGEKLWHYSPPFEAGERGQVITTSAKGTLPRMTALIMAGAYSKNSSQIKTEALGGNRFLLTPKPGALGSVQKATIQVDPEKLIIVRVELIHEDGNTSDIDLKNLKLGVKLDDSLFTFQIPPNTDIVKE